MKTALIAGGTSGVGLSVAKALIKKDYKVFLIGQNGKKGKAVEAQFAADSPGQATFIQLDLSNLRETTLFSKQFLKKHAKLDLLAHMAGIMAPKRQVTPEGFEKTFTIGYLSALILSTQLEPILSKAGGRIVHIAGEPSFVLKPRLNFDNLDFSKNYTSFGTAITTVHAKTVLTEILAEKYAAKGIDVNSFHPGAVQSDLMHNMPWWGRLIYTVLSPFLAKNSETGIYVCSSPDIKGVSGKLYKKNTAQSLAFDTDYKEKLWQASQDILAKVK